MEKKITFLHEELKSKNTIITLLLENVVKRREKKNTKSTQSIETVEREIMSTEPLNIIVNYTGNKSSNLNNTVTSQNKVVTNRKKALIKGDSIVKNIERWRPSKRMKSSVAVKSIPGATTKGMKHHIKRCLEDNFPDSIILHVGTNNLKNKESVEDIANDIMDVSIFVRDEKTNVFVSGLTVQNDRLNDKGKSVNSLLKCRCDEEKYVL